MIALISFAAKKSPGTRMAAKAKGYAGWITGRILGTVAGVCVGLPTSNLGESKSIVAFRVRIQFGIHQNGRGRNTDLCVARDLKPIREAICADPDSKGISAAGDLRQATIKVPEMEAPIQYHLSVHKLLVCCCCSTSAHHSATSIIML